MKQLELELKKRLLIVEADYQEDCIGAFIEDGQIYTKVYGDVKYWAAGFLENVDIEGKWKAICKGSELTEEVADDLVHGIEDKTALESFISAIEAKNFHWDNNPEDKFINNELNKYWFDEEEKNFNPEKTIIFEILL